MKPYADEQEEFVHFEGVDPYAFERSQIYCVFDSAAFCHVGFVRGSKPHVLVAVHVRIDDTIYLHESASSELLKAAAGTRVCIAVSSKISPDLFGPVSTRNPRFRTALAFGRPEVLTSTKISLDKSNITEHTSLQPAGHIAQLSRYLSIHDEIIKIDIEELSAEIQEDSARIAFPQGLQSWSASSSIQNNFFKSIF